jgi:hypothetical protein
MTTLTTTSPTPSGTARRRDFTNAARAELAKLTTVRSTWWTLLIAVAANVGFAVLAGAVIAPRLSARDRAGDHVRLALAGVHISQIAIGVLGALVITSEYSSGMIRTTLAAVPRRRTLLAAKALVFTGVSLIVCTASTFAAYLAFQAALPVNTLTRTSLSDPGVARAVTGGGLYLTALGLLGFGLGVLLRSTAGAIATLLGLLFVPPLLLELLPDSWKNDVGPYIPMESGAQIYVAVKSEAVALAPWTGFAVFCAYATLALATGFLLANRRDV